MRIPRVFVSQALAEGVDLELSAQASHYLTKVLRMQAGRELIAFNGDGAEYPSNLISADKRGAVIRVAARLEADRESPLHTHLAIGISRGERMDWVLQKATELGVAAITPLFTERTEVKLTGERLDKKLEHWRQVAISACEQCQRNRLPVVHEPQPLEQFLNTHQAELKLVLHHRSDATLKQLTPPRSATLLVGPEGGLSDTEIERALSFGGFRPLTLGPRVLRTETAPVAALTAVQLLWGDLA